MSSTPTTAQGPQPSSALDRYFKITQRGSTVSREIRGGFVTFFTMAYIVVLNPIIIGTVKDGTGHFLGGGTAPNLTMVAACTALIAGIMSMLMGAIANFPLGIAAGLGLNAFIAYSVASLPKMTWADAMGLVVLEGLVILVLVLTGFRTAVFKAVPRELKTAITLGIGLFICIVALADAGFNSVGGGLLQLGMTGTLGGWPILVFIFGVFLIAILMVRKVPGAILIGIVSATLLAVLIESIGHLGTKDDATGKMTNPNGWALNAPKFPNDLLAKPDFGLLGHFSLLGSFSKLGVVSAILIVFTLVLSDFFDLMGTMVAVGTEGNLLDETGTPEGSQKVMIVDSLAAVAGGAGSVSSNTGFIESASGVGEGARTGLASIVTGVLFLLTTFLSPIVNMVPSEAAAPALVLVGYLMMTQASSIDWKDMEIGIPAFLTMALMPFTYSISVGIGAGFITYVLIKLAKGKGSQVHPLMWGVCAMFVIFFAIEPIKQMLGVS